MKRRTFIGSALSAFAAAVAVRPRTSEPKTLAPTSRPKGLAMQSETCRGTAPLDGTLPPWPERTPFIFGIATHDAAAGERAQLFRSGPMPNHVLTSPVARGAMVTMDHVRYSPAPAPERGAHFLTAAAIVATQLDVLGPELPHDQPGPGSANRHQRNQGREGGSTAPLTPPA